MYLFNVIFYFYDDLVFKCELFFHFYFTMFLFVYLPRGIDI